MESLGLWLQQQVLAYRHNQLPNDRSKMLESLPNWETLVGVLDALSDATSDSDVNDEKINVDIEQALQNNVIEKFLQNGNGWILYAQEYTVIPFMCNMGKGDLVFFHKEQGRLHVIECKKHKPVKTHQQSVYYAAWWKLQHPQRRVTYQSVILDASWSHVEDMDLHDAGFILLKKFTELEGLNDKEIKTMANAFTHLYCK